MPKQETIAFIGGGNLARSLIGGLIAAGTAPETIWVANPTLDKLASLKEKFHVNTTQDNLEAAKKASIIVFAVKPQVMPQVAQLLSPIVQETQAIVLSLAAGIEIGSLRQWLGDHARVIRAMPNVAAMVSSAATGLFAPTDVSQAARDVAESIMRAIGVTAWVENENHIDIVTALSGSGPAYFFLIMESMVDCAVEMGLSRETARLLTLQTCLGSAHLALESRDELANLRASVTSPGGTTAAAISALQDADIDGIIRQALQAARARAVELKFSH